MKRISRGAMALLVTVAGTIGAGAVAAAPASAATCQGSCWAGKDPNKTICQNDAVTPIPAAYYGGAKIELRYSPTCRAAWARISHFTGDVMVVHNSAGANQYAIGGNSSFTWTAMVNDMNLTSWACIDYGGGNVKACTKHY